MSAIVINMQFGQAEVISNSDKAALKKAEVFQIDLVFSNFPAEYDMNDLNKRRIEMLKSLRSDLVSDETVEWRLIRQMRCKNEAEAKTLFHGIVIHYRPEQSKETIAVDTKWLLGNLPPSASLDSPKKIMAELPDTSVIHVLNRNAKKWKEMVVVSDLTGSMTPYASQVVLWLKLSTLTNSISSVTFFNDGDMKTVKEIGKTGGIYTVNSSDYDTIRALALTTIANGGGGDAPENDIEAIIYAQEKNPKAKEIILIADNMAPIKDLVLASKVTKPIRVVLCGTNYGINVEYLNLARETGGSVHTMEKDLEDLKALSEGKTFTLNGKLFKITGDKIVEVKKV